LRKPQGPGGKHRAFSEGPGPEDAVNYHLNEIKCSNNENLPTEFEVGKVARVVCQKLRCNGINSQREIPRQWNSQYSSYVKKKLLAKDLASHVPPPAPNKYSFTGSPQMDKSSINKEFENLLLKWDSGMLDWGEADSERLSARSEESRGRKAYLFARGQRAMRRKVKTGVQMVPSLYNYKCEVNEEPSLSTSFNTSRPGETLSCDTSSALWKS
ncbi:hypothetical protein Tco_1240912, partial [Tanacetum coccineum]